MSIINGIFKATVILLLVMAAMAQEIEYAELYMMKSPDTCISSVTQQLTTPTIHHCIHSCLSAGYDCKSLTYTSTDRSCEISDLRTTSSCSDSGVITYQATERSPSTTTTTSATPTNLSPGATIAASAPPYLAYYPEKIIDGLAEQATSSDSYCNQDAYPYVTIDLGAEYTILYVVMWSRPNSYTQVNDMDFRVATSIAGIDADSALCYYRPETPSVRPETFECTAPITGRYVRAARLAGSGYLCFCELEIFGY